MMKHYLPLLCCFMLHCDLYSGKRTVVVPHIEAPKEDQKDKDQTPQIMAANFFNILMHGFAAAHSTNKEERVNYVLNALAAMATMIQLAFKDKKKADELYKLLSHPIILERLENIVATRGKQLELLAKNGLMETK